MEQYITRKLNNHATINNHATMVNKYQEFVKLITHKVMFVFRVIRIVPH